MNTGSIQQLALGLIIICLIALPSTLAFRKNNAGAAIVGAVCGLAAVLVFIPQVQSFSFGPLRAAMRAKINEADATLDQLRGLASDLARVSVLSVVEQGDLAGPGYETFYAIRENLRRQLVVLHTSPDTIKEILNPLNPRIQLALDIQIQGSALDGRNNTPSWQPLYTCTSNAMRNSSVDGFRKCFNSASVSSPSLERMLSELAEFQQTHQITRLNTAQNNDP